VEQREGQESGTSNDSKRKRKKKKDKNKRGKKNNGIKESKEMGQHERDETTTNPGLIDISKSIEGAEAIARRR